MSDVEYPEPSPEQIAEAETNLLQHLYDSYSDAQGTSVAAGMLTSLVPKEDGSLNQLALANLIRDGLVEYRDSSVTGLSNAQFMVITPNGIRQLGKRKPGITFGETDHLNEKLKDVEARIAERAMEARLEQKKLAEQMKEVNARIVELDDKLAQWGTISQEVQQEEERLRLELETVGPKIDGVERRFYERIMPFFAAFVAVFALIINGAQAASRVISADPTMTLQASIFVLILVASLGILLIGTTFMFSRWTR